MPIGVEPLKPAIGGIVRVDRQALVDPDVIQSIHQALEDRSVLVFPELHLTDEEQLALTDRLGKRVNHARNLEEADAAKGDIYQVSFDNRFNDRKEFVQGAFFWHIDGVMVDAPISKATLLTARRLSERGGQTEFASMYAAYEALPEQGKALLEGLRARHSLAPSMKLIFEDPTPEQLESWRVVESDRPIVWTHASGRRSLVIGCSADRVVGMPVPDGRALLLRLLEWASQPAFRYTHAWKEGDLVLWDNTGVMHRVIPYAETSGRTMHRTTIAGVELIA